MKLFYTILIFITTSIFLNAQTSEVEFITKDTVKISATFELPKDVKANIPAVILIHQGGSSRQEWKELTLWNKLLKNGYAILAYDVRLHGKSGKDAGNMYDLFNNPKRAPLDLKAAITFLENDKRIDKKRIGVIGASIGGNLATAAASLDDYNVKSVVVMSAKTSAAQNLSGQEAILTPKNAFYIASTDEQKGARKKWAEELHQMTSGNKKIAIAKGSKHGSFILREDKALEDQIVQWVKESL